MTEQDPLQAVTEVLGGGYATHTSDGGIYRTPSAEEDLAPADTHSDTVKDLYGDSLFIAHTRWSTRGVLSLTLVSEDPEQDTLVYDLDGAKKLRDTLTRIIDAQEAGQ